MSHPISPVTFRLATLSDSEYLLSMINKGYAISEKFMWKENTVRTHLPDVQAIAAKTFSQQDTYILAINSDDQIVASIRYEPQITLVHLESKTIHGPISFTQLFPEQTNDCNELYNIVSVYKHLDPAGVPQLPENSPIFTILNSLPGSWQIRCSGYFSQFVTNPELQRGGYGSQLLAHIETLTVRLPLIVSSSLQAHPALASGMTLTAQSGMRMIVLSPRQDMIDFYEKKGYSKSQVSPAEPYMFEDVIAKYRDDLVKLEYAKDITANGPMCRETLPNGV